MLLFFQDTGAEFHLFTVATKHENSSLYRFWKGLPTSCEYISETKIKGPDSEGHNAVTRMDGLTGPMILIIIVFVDVDTVPVCLHLTFCQVFRRI